VDAPKPVVAVQLVAATAVPQIIVSPAAAKSAPELPPPVRMHLDEHLALATPAQRDSSPVEQGPRLERASRGEVLLITAPQHPQLAQFDRRIPSADALARGTPPQRLAVPPRQRAVMLAATQVRWLPLKALEPSNVQLLNAARSQGLAAQSRNVLADRGWRRLAIGNAREVRQHSLVLYGPTRMHLATRLARQFRCNTIKVAGMKSVVVLLGRDAVRHGSPSYRRA